MKKSLLIAVIVVSMFFGTTSVFAEQIDSFNSKIEVRRDGFLDVTETIVYNPQGEAHHGILRNIPLKNAQGGRIDISNISVVNERGVPYQFVQTGFGEVDLKIGNPDNTFTTPNTYVISYTVSGAYSYYKDFDEIYWNATGNNWPFPIINASAEISLPSGVTALQSACYYGVTGSKQSCDPSVNRAYGVLVSGEGLTVAVGFPKSVIPPESYGSKTTNLIINYLWILMFLLAPVTTFIIFFKKWKKNWRAPKGAGVIIAQYDAPQGLTPIELGSVLKENFSSKYISAEIIYLATKGYLKISESKRNILFFSTKDYELKKIKEPDALLSATDKLLMDCLFATGDLTVLSKLEKTFYVFIPAIKKAVSDGLVAKGLFKQDPNKLKNILIFIGIGYFFVSIFFGATTGSLLSIILGARASISLFVGIAVSAFIVFIFNSIVSVKTTNGVAASEWILGFKEYLQIAEKDRINFANAPEKKPETFEKFLPYAMSLGVEKAWAKEFEGIYVAPPDWYSGTSGHAFSAIVFANSLSSFSTMASSSLSSAPGGSGGGGSSGGGGGGGGGGSW